MTWGIVGATGHTGRMIAREAVARGEHPLLLGRNPVSLRAIADELALPFRVTGGPAALIAAALDVDLIVNAAGPFAVTAQPVLDACVAGSAHYLDLSNEFEPVHRIFAQHDRLRAAGISAIPAAGFGTVATDAAALAAVAALASRLPSSALRVDVAMLAQNDGGGAGTGASVAAVMSVGAVRLRDGAIVRSRLGSGITSTDTPLGRRSIVPLATGDVVTVARSTGAASVTAGAAFRAPALALRLGLPVAQALTRAHALRSIPEPATHAPFRSAAWARAGDGEASATAWLTTGEGYAFTAASVVTAAIATRGGMEPGAHTVATAFGADFALRVPGTRIRVLD